MNKEKIKLSASKIGTIQKCSFQYYCSYVLKLPKTGSIATDRGSLVHLVFECLANKRHKKHVDFILNTDDIPECIKKLVLKHAKKHKMDDEENLNLIYDMIRVGIQSDFYGGPDVILDLVEDEFNFEGENYRLNGFIDRLFQYKDNSLTVVDFKSSKARFSKSELPDNLQVLMYSLAVYKKYGKIPQVKFLFVRFPRNPWQEGKLLNKRTLEGFEVFLSQLADFLQDFDYKKAIADMAYQNSKNCWLCGKEGLKKDGTQSFICEFRKPMDYYAILDKDGNVIKTAHKKEDLKPKEGESIEAYSYSGCPAWHSPKKFTFSKMSNFD